MIEYRGKKSDRIPQALTIWREYEPLHFVPSHELNFTDYEVRIDGVIYNHWSEEFNNVYEKAVIWLSLNRTSE